MAIGWGPRDGDLGLTGSQAHARQVISGPHRSGFGGNQVTGVARRWGQMPSLERIKWLTVAGGLQRQMRILSAS